MSDQYLPPAPDQHDTAAYGRQAPPAAAGYGTGYGPGQAGYAPGHTGAAGPGTQDWYVPGQATGIGNPEADYWAGRYRSQRRWTRVLAGTVALGTLLVVGLGFAAVQAVRSDPLASAAAQLGGSLDDRLLPAPAEEGAGSGGSDPATPPEGQVPDGQAGPAPDSIPLDSLPLPEDLRSLAGALGIDDVEDLVALGVANGLLTEEQADQLRAAIVAGKGLQGLLGGSSTGSAQGTTQG